MIPAAVLTGGRSTRMGRDKALIAVRGRAMVLRVADALRSAGCGPVVLVGDCPGLAGLGLPVLPDPEGFSGHPLAGVVTACTLGPLVVTAPCDIPMLRPEDVRALLAVGGPAEAIASGRRQPLLGVVDAAVREGLQHAVVTGQSARRALAGRISVMLPNRVGRNINTPAELAMLQSLREDIDAK